MNEPEGREDDFYDFETYDMAWEAFFKRKRVYLKQKAQNIDNLI